MSANNPSHNNTPSSPSILSSVLSFFRDVRVIQIIGQILFVILVVWVLSQLAGTASSELRSKGLSPNFNFLQDRAGFDISESPDWYTPNSLFVDALKVGIINTLRIVSVGLVLSTVLGILVGVFLLSTNWLVKNISRVYVEILRNTPLLVQLFIWYYIVLFSLPQPREAITVPAEGVIFLPLRFGLYILLYLFLWRSVRKLPTDSPRRIITLVGFFAAAFVTEVAFYLTNTQASWSTAYGSGAITAIGFLIYLAVSALLLAGAYYFAPPRLRPFALGAAAGQAIGGLLFYFGIMPNSALRIELYPALYLSIRGMAYPEIAPTGRITEWLAFVTLGAILAGIIWVYSGRVTEATGKAIPRFRYAVLAVVGLAALGWFFVSLEPPPGIVPVDQEGTVTLIPLDEAVENDLLTPEQKLEYSNVPFVILMPEQNRLGRFVAGTEISPEYVALLLGLVIYTSAFIAEIVRAGIQAVSFGQVEAARAVGLKQSQVLTMIILPQALRVIIPPLGNQYLNLAKNSSLAIAIAYADLFTTMTTVMNQSGQSITGILIIMLLYLVMSLVISFVMNIVNGRFQLVTR